MSQEKKERVGILMPPSQVAKIDALYPLHGHASRSDFVCKAVEFYTGFLQQGSSEFYMRKTTLAFLEEQLGRLENRICRQLFRICVEQEMACHMFASQCLGEPKETLEELRRNCVRAVKRTAASATTGSTPTSGAVWSWRRMKMEKKTEKVTVSLSPEVIRLVDQNWEKFGFKNRSGLIDAAIREYISRDLLKEFTGELSQFYQKIERSEIKHLEEHLAKLSYKIAVEIAQMHLLMASITALSKQDTHDLRAKAVALVNESKGYISLETARKHKVPLQLEADVEAEDDGW